jgi:hypothetical protein
MTVDETAIPGNGPKGVEQDFCYLRSKAGRLTYNGQAEVLPQA